MEQVQTEGDRKIKRKSQFYNLDFIISVGYRTQRIASKEARETLYWLELLE